MFDHTYKRLFYSLLVGLGSGFFGGFLGMTGSIIILPMLILVGIFNNYRLAIATVLFSFDPLLSIFALIQYAKEKKIDYLVGIIIAFSYMLGSYIGAKFNKRISEKNLKYTSATFMLVLAFYMFYNANKT